MSFAYRGLVRLFHGEEGEVCLYLFVYFWNGQWKFNRMYSCVYMSEYVCERETESIWSRWHKSAVTLT